MGWVPIVGIYGVTAYATAQRKRELAIRVAIGASRADVIRPVLLRATKPLLAGAALGLCVAAGLSRFLSAVLFEVDPLVLVSSIAGLVIAGVIDALSGPLVKAGESVATIALPATLLP
jgi:ABC-type antimicrobial peptide transport system permease subunit